VSDQTITHELDLETRFPDFVGLDTRQGFQGYIVQADRLLEFTTILRDDLGFDYLSSLTGVDYLPQNQMEVVYHVYKTTGGPALVFKVQLPREDPIIPSIVSIYPGAEFQEREAWDLLGSSSLDIQIYGGY
jgi:NADH-quinone oxidoreductase subunit C/D